MAQPLAANTWIQQTLANDVTLAGLVGDRIYEDVADRDAVYPLVVYHLQDANDTNGVAGARILERELYTVKVVGRDTSYLPLKSIYARVDALLHRQGGKTGDGDQVKCVRESSIKFVSVEDGLEYRHLGGLYRLWIISA